MHTVKSCFTTTCFVLLAVCLSPSLAERADPVWTPLSREAPLSRVVLELYRQEIEANEGFGERSRGSIASTQALERAAFDLSARILGRRLCLDLRSGRGAFTRSSGSFGPIFAERALTVGRGRS